MVKRFKQYALYAVIISLVGCGLLSKNSAKYIKLETDYTQTGKYTEIITEDLLRKHLTVIASDEYEGRETGMAGQKKAAAYIEKYFKEIGLQPGVNKTEYLQSFPLDYSDPSKISFKIDTEEIKFIEEFYYLGNIPDTSYLNRDVVYIGYGIDVEGKSDYNGIDLHGKVVLVKEGIGDHKDVSVRWANWRTKLSAAEKHGAAGMITIQEDYTDKVERIKYFIENPTMRLHQRRNTPELAIPNIYMNSETAARLFDYENIESSFTQKKASIEIATHKIIYSENVLGYLEGTDLKDELLVITAHYDHIGYDNGEICNGADDDGSGTVTLMNIAKAFMVAKNEGNGPRRSILFMTVSGEEKGLLGSEYYAKHPIYPLDNTITNLNIDMIGRKDSLHKDYNYLYVIGADRISEDLHYISEKTNENTVNMELDYTYNKESDPNNFYYRSDHYNFAKNGIPVIFYFSGVHEDYHKPTDDVDKINFSKLEKAGRLIFYTAWELVNRTEKPRKNA